MIKISDPDTPHTGIVNMEGRDNILPKGLKKLYWSEEVFTQHLVNH